MVKPPHRVECGPAVVPARQDDASRGREIDSLDRVGVPSTRAPLGWCRVGAARWGRLADPRPASPQAQAEGHELRAAIERSIAEDLTPRQRAIFTAVVLQEVPIDVVAERLGSTRGAVYKMVHDARRKLRAHLAARGWSVPGAEGGAA